ncbi:1A family penicillin-binding protein, partial [Burkholderia sp. TJI49]
TDPNGAIVARAQPLVADQNAPRAIDARNAYVTNSLLQSVAQRGTGARTNVLKRTDLAGKTGTTNDSHDAWFAGYQHTLAAIAWIGYDNPRSLGDRETGGGLALPVWIDYMGAALKGVPEYKPTVPDGVESLGGELYFTDFTPGHGFVSTVGVPQAPAPQDTDEAVPHVDEQEKQDIMNLFRGH